MMDKDSKLRVDSLLLKEPAALTEEETAFLKARRTYLTVEHQRHYGLIEEPQAEEVPAPEATPEAPIAPKKAKK